MHAPFAQTSREPHTWHAPPKLPHIAFDAPGWHTPFAAQHPLHVSALQTAPAPPAATPHAANPITTATINEALMPCPTMIETP